MHQARLSLRSRNRAHRFCEKIEKRLLDARQYELVMLDRSQTLEDIDNMWKGVLEELKNIPVIPPGKADGVSSVG